MVGLLENRLENFVSLISMVMNKLYFLIVGFWMVNFVFYYL